MRDSTRRTGMRDAQSGARGPALTIAVLYPSRSLAEQVADQAAQWGAYRFRLLDEESVNSIRADLRGAAVVVVDATEDPARAVAAVEAATSAAQTPVVAVYSETMHEGLELSVRSRGALLLPGPVDAGQWEGVFEAGRRVARKSPCFGFLTKQGAVGTTGSNMPRPSKRSWERKPQDKYRKTA